MKKHAYLIMAHTDIEVYKLLIKLIDDERNDIFVHIDKKSNPLPFKNVIAKKSKIFFLKSRDVRWGHSSLIKLELDLFEMASKNDSYSYYHLLSGVCLPIKSQDYIHNFFDSQNNKEFISFQKVQPTEQIKERTLYYHFFTRYFRSQNSFVRCLSIKLHHLFFYILKKMNIQKKTNFILYKGDEWCSITDNFVRLLTTKKKQIVRFFSNSFCCDEIYKQTIIMNSTFKDCIYKNDNGNTDSLRAIDWIRGSPYVWKDDDINILKESNKLFARKFSSNDENLLKQVENLCKIT